MTPPLLTDWHALHALTTSMLKLAHSEQWDELAKHEVRYAQLLEKLLSHSSSEYPPAQLEQARFLLSQILNDESELKLLLKTRMDELSTLMAQTEKQRALSSAYGKISENVLHPQNIERG